VHALAVNFYTPLVKDLIPLSKLNVQEDISEERILPQQSRYFNNKILSEEGNYTEKRQRETGMVGNNLQKPPIFIKRELVRETNQAQEELYQGFAF
jgi:hypothetical protein